MTATDWTTDAVGTGAFADVNGLHLYHESHGSGRPLILLHGGLGTGAMFGPVIPLLAASHRVITVDLQAHGRTADIDRPIDIGLMADDIAALIEHLGLDRPDLLGYSLGGGVAANTGSKYPHLVRKVILVSQNLTPDAIDPALRAQQNTVDSSIVDQLKDTPMYQGYVAVAPRPEDFGQLLDKIGELMTVPYDHSDVILSLFRNEVPTMLVAADADMAPPSHQVEIFKLLDGGLRDGGWMDENRPNGGHALAIIPNATHYNVFMSPVLAAAALDFLGRP